MVNVEVAKLLESSFIKAREYLLTKGYEESQVVKKNPTGDVSRTFDIKVEELLINDLSRNFPDYGVISEEVGDLNTKLSKNFFVIDPVDGSYNFIRKIGGASCSIALFDNYNKNLKNVFFAFVGNYLTGNIFFAERDLGAYENYKRINCNRVYSIYEAVAGINFDFNIPKEREKVLSMLKSFKKIRYIGAASVDLCNVANGAYDAFVDIRDDLTPENFCAAQLIIKEAGGVFTDGLGNEITNFYMTDRFSIIASANTKLLKNIIKILYDTDS
ncbi:MAG: hypothetical protein M1371_07805 [Actinobacteria bacterium]|nr:hypothetical protein [Actinomycetota bacterium]